MANYITVDGGTTNTRLTLVCDHAIVDTLKYGIGAAVGCDAKDSLKQALKEGIENILHRNGLSESDIDRILASGMITSEGGICMLKHMKTPCGISELAKGMHECVIEEISTIPFVFARGVITDTEELDRLDMMRGEETELFGLTEYPECDCLYILPGTHSKMIYTDKHGRICEFWTSLSGDLISATSGHTILKGSITLEPCEIDAAYLQRGYECAKEHGIGTALFKVRILDKVLGSAKEQSFSFFLGAVLQGEVDSVIRSAAKKVVIGGKHELRAPLARLLRDNTQKEITEAEDSVAMTATVHGIIRLYEEHLRNSI